MPIQIERDPLGTDVRLNYFRSPPRILSHGHAPRTLRDLIAFSAALELVVLSAALREFSDPTTPTRTSRVEVLLGTAMVLVALSLAVDPRHKWVKIALACLSMVVALAASLLPRST